MHQNEALLKYLASQLEAKISPFIAHGEPYAVLDYPDHSNVGDCAIWLGEMALLQKLAGGAPRYVASVKDFTPADMDRLHPDGTIFIHGGGNLGDLWMHHQLLREELLRRYKGRRIVQLPQSIQFRDMARADAFACLVDTHNDFHILTRDQRSTEFALRRFNCAVQLTPDMAFGLGALVRPDEPRCEVFCLLREDSEKSDVDDGPLRSLPNSLVGDWLHEPRFFALQSSARNVRPWLQSARADLQSWRWLKYQRLASGRVQRGLAILSQGRVVLTDRLHAHILSVLMGLPNIVLDNNYGKIHGYMEAWTKDAWQTYAVKSSQEALAALGLLQGHR